MAKPGIQLIRQKTDLEEIDYSYVIDCLKEHSTPRAKVTRMLKARELIRVKKGLYVFGESYRRRMYSLEILANKVYGPSYISLEYALSFYGMIPEYVSEVTSVTSKRKRAYVTPVGRFSYTPLPLALYAIGYTLALISDDREALIASPEKALADLLYVRKIKISTEAELEQLLFEDLRLDSSQILDLDIKMLTEILDVGGNPILFLLITYIRSRK